MKNSRFCSLVVLIFVAACGGYDCSKAEMSLGFIGFSKTESDSIVLRKYSRGDNFRTYLDSATITPTNTQYQFTGDTLIFVVYTGNINLVSDQDYEIYFPKIAKSYRVTKITEEQTSKNWGLSCNKDGCINPLINYELDEKFVDARNYNNRIFVKK